MKVGAVENLITSNLNSHSDWLTGAGTHRFAGSCRVYCFSASYLHDMRHSRGVKEFALIGQVFSNNNNNNNHQSRLKCSQNKMNKIVQVVATEPRHF